MKDNKIVLLKTGVVNKNGRWIQPEIDLGKAPQDLESEKDGEHSSNYYENMGKFL